VQPFFGEDGPVRDRLIRRAQSKRMATMRVKVHLDRPFRLPQRQEIGDRIVDVVDRIVSAPRDARDLPNEPVAMTSVTIHPEQG